MPRDGAAPAVARGGGYSTTVSPQGSTLPTPPAELPDRVLAIAARLRLPRRHRRQLERELELRCGSDRGGRRQRVDLGAWLLLIEDAAV